MSKFDKNRDYLKEKTIWLFWTGANEMSQNRKNCFDKFCEVNKDCNVQLVTHEDVKALEGLHKGFHLLSEVHKADYLRSYFMHHFGGGYSDVKIPSNKWSPIFDYFIEQKEKFILGYPETGADDMARVDLCPLDPKEAKYCREYILDESNQWSFGILRDNWQKAIGNGCYIARPNTDFTKEWLSWLNDKMDQYYDKLLLNPASNPYDHYNLEQKYPIFWTELCGNIFHPLTIKYNEKILQEPRIRFHSQFLHDYR
jgi:hypothetical protein